MRLAAALLTAPLLLGGCASPAAIAPPGSTATPSATSAPAAAATPSARPSAGPAAEGGTAFTSTQYGYTLMLPDGWQADAATVPWDGGDIDHTAEYADYLVDPDGNEFFAIGASSGGATADTVADDHLAWLTEYRGCPAPSARQTTTIDGEPAVRVAIHCPEGVFGPTLVSKAITVHDGSALILTSFSPDDGSDEFPAFDAWIQGLRWSR